MFQQVLQAVEHAHSRSVLHRDLKPSNILVTPAGQVRLLDFGIAKLLVDGLAQETELTAQWGRALTRDYASPEQLAGQPVSARSDVYTLGVILHELLCGQRPDTASRDAGAGDDGAFLGVELTPPSECCSAKAPVATAEGGATALSRQLAGDLDAIVLRALRLNPAARYPDAAAMAEDIARVLSREPAQPTLQRWRLRLVLMLRRHRAAVSLSSLLFLGIAMLGHAHRAAADIETLFAPTLPEPQRVVLINVGTEDLQRVFHGVRPLDPATFQKLVARISDGQPAVLGVDIDTSAPAYKVLPQGMAPEALQRIVWARGITASDRTDQLPDPRPVLGSDFAETPARSGLALSVADGNSGAVRWFVRLIPTVRGPLPSFATEVVRGLIASDERLPTALRSVRYWRGERTEFPVSVVLAPGFDWQDRIKGRVVLLGGSYDPADVHPTSLGLMHGLEVQANIVETELSGTAYIRPSVGAILIVGLANLAAAIGFFGHMRARWAIPASLAFGFGLAAATAATGWFPAWPYAVMAALVALANQTVAELLHRRGWSLGRGLRTLWQRRTGTGSRP
jgi:CHASE2 domain-containing sensor protein